MSLRDPITQLPNEALFMDRLGQALALARRKRTRIGLLQLALEDGDALTDDEVLRALASRIGTQLRNTDTVSRLGDHDFTVLLSDVDSRPAARAVAEELLIALSRPLEIAGRSMPLTAHYGLSMFPDDADDEKQLLAQASAELLRSLTSA